jgi:AcrR family transcriptional regulator
MEGEAGPAPRELLLDRVIAHLEESGLGDTSLRGLAEAVGTSHRMLSYHFGSRGALLVEVSREVERRQREAFAALVADEDAEPVAVMREMYERFTDPALAGAERLFFELYARALQGEGEAAGFLADVVDAWIGPVVPLFERLGFSRAEAEAEARLAIAGCRGLLLDLLATGDRKAVDAAVEAYLARYS